MFWPAYMWNVSTRSFDELVVITAFIFEDRNVGSSGAREVTDMFGRIYPSKYSLTRRTVSATLSLDYSGIPQKVFQRFAAETAKAIVTSPADSNYTISGYTTR